MYLGIYSNALRLYFIFSEIDIIQNVWKQLGTGYIYIEMCLPGMTTAPKRTY